MAKINPFLEKKIFGLAINEYLGISCGAFCGSAADSCFTIESPVLKFALFCVAWILGMVLYTVVIALIKTYITKEE